MTSSRMVMNPGNRNVLRWFVLSLVVAAISLSFITSAPRVEAQAGYEGDVTPRPSGKGGAANQTDYEQLARFAAGVETAADGSEFQRADCAPRATLGDGRVGMADLVQAMRYAAKLDPLTTAGGPTVANKTAVNPQVTEAAREVRVGTPTFAGALVTVPIELIAQGNENALGFTLAFDTAALSQPIAVLGTDATAALLITNPTQIGSGRLGIGIALPAGQKFAAGTRQILRVSFTIAQASFGQQTPIGFASSPVQLEIADELGNLLDQRIFTGDQITLNYPIPTVSALNPGSAFAGDPNSFTLGVVGTNFVTGSVVRWGGTNLTTTFQSPTLLTATVPASLIAAAGTASITVFNPTPGGGVSNALTFFINNPVPSLTGLSLATLAAGSAAGTLDVTGNGFVPGSVVFWNGRPCPTRFISRTRLIVDYAAADVACAGIIRVTVVSPTPGGGTSVAQTFTIAPTVTSITPSLVYTTDSTFTLTVTGTGFCEGARIRVNGVPRTSTIVSPTQITTTINASELTPARNLPISVVSSDGVVSNAVPLQISDCSPARARVTLAAALDFGTATPARQPIPNRTSQTFTVENTGCQTLNLNFAIRRTGDDVTSGKITNPDDSGTFVLFNTTGGANAEIRSGATLSIPGGRLWTFRVEFDPKVPTPAGRITNLAASQVISDIITSTLTISQGANTLGTANLTGRVETQSRFIDPIAPRLDPVPVFIRSGADEFTVEISGYDADTNITSYAYQFYDQNNNRVGSPQNYDLNLRGLGLLKGQSFTIIRKFAVRDAGNAAYKVVAFFYDADGQQSYATSGPVGTGRGRIVNATTVSGGSFRAEAVSTESIASAFGESLSNKTEAATTLPVPKQLGDVRVYVTDANLVERAAPLFFVSPTQINYLIPEGTVAGEAKVVVVNQGTVVASGAVQVADMAPALFTANSDGKGAPAAYAVRVKADNSQRTEAVAQFDSAQNKFVPAPISLGAPEDQIVLVLFGTGIRYYSAMNRVSVKIAGVEAPVDYAGPQGQYVGLDQVNVRLPRSLLVGGEVDLVLSVDGKAANPVRIHVR